MSAKLIAVIVALILLTIYTLLYNRILGVLKENDTSTEVLNTVGKLLKVMAITVSILAGCLILFA